MNHDRDIERVMEQYGNSIYRVSFFILQNSHDAQDILQETIIKYMQKAPAFVDDSHEKAWLLRVANNLCKDMLRFKKRNACVNLDELISSNGELLQLSGENERERECGLIMQIFTLPEKYKWIIYLHYYEGYTIKETARILKLTEGAVKKRLERGRNMLRQILEEDM